MPKKRPYRRRQSRPKSPPGGWRVERRVEGPGWALVAPRAVRERAEDLDEVRQMIDGGEPEIASDELRWLLAECPEHVEAHALLGELAAAQNDLPLARAHAGYAFQIGEKTLDAARCPGPLPGADARNAAWHDAALVLAWALEKQGESNLADQVAATVKRLDPKDPAGVGAALDELRTGGKPIVGLG